MKRRDTGDSTTPHCVVSDRVMYRSLLRGGLDSLADVRKVLNKGRTGGRRFLDAVWKLIVRYQHLETDGRTKSALTGKDFAAYERFRDEAGEIIAEKPVKEALDTMFPRKVRQFAKDLRLANDFEFFCAGGLDLRDEIELARIYAERHYRRMDTLTRALRELELADARLQTRLASFLERKDAFAEVGPNEGFGLSPGTVPPRFWWRYFATEADLKAGEQNRGAPGTTAT